MSEKNKTPESMILKDIQTLPVYLNSGRQLWLYCREDVFVSRCGIIKYNKKYVVVNIYWDDYELSYIYRFRIDSYGKSWILFMDNAPSKEQLKTVPWKKRVSWLDRIRKKKAAEAQ